MDYLDEAQSLLNDIAEDVETDAERQSYILHSIACATIAQVEATRGQAAVLAEIRDLLKRVTVSTSHHMFLMDEEPTGPNWARCEEAQ